MKKALHMEIKRRYEKLKDEALERQMQKKREIYEKIPRIEEIDQNIRLLGVKYNKLVLMGSGLFSKDTEEILSTLDSLKKEKSVLLEKAGYPEDYMEIDYRCNQCKDTGYIENGSVTEKCTCHKQMIIDILYSRSNLKLASGDNFDSFDETLYSDTVDVDRYKINISPRENIRRIKEKCMEFIAGFESPETKNLFFSGPAGVGKTFLSNCIALELLKKGKTVLYQTAPRLFDIISENKIKMVREGDFQDDIYE